MSARVIARGSRPPTPEEQTIISSAMVRMGVWDEMPLEDREALLNRAEVLDTPFGKSVLMEMVIRSGAINTKGN